MPTIDPNLSYTPEGYPILPPIPADAIPKAPLAVAQEPLTPVGTQVSLWRPADEEFPESDYDLLCASLGRTQLVCFDQTEDVKDGVKGVTLSCTVVN